MSDDSFEILQSSAVKATPMTEELKDCPFCGDLAWPHHSRSAFSGHCSGGSEGWRIECEGKCHAMTCWWHSKQEAVEAWNSRSGEKT